MRQQSGMGRLVRGLFERVAMRSVYAYKVVFSSKKRIFRWTFGVNLAILLACFAVRRDQINLILTNQTDILAQLYIPTVLRKPIYSAYSRHYHVNTQEAELALKEYTTFSQFFTRKISRKAAQEVPNTISSPCDGKVLKISQVTEDSCHIIKDSHYSLSELVLGDSKSLAAGQSIAQFLKINKSNKVYQVIIYLAPGDYHRFHSPLKMGVLKVKNIPGNVQSVNEDSLSRARPVYEKNVRKVLFGRWQSGLLTMVMVGALNVSKIYINAVQSVERGEQLGYFNLGSTIVMLVEAKGVGQWHVTQGQRVEYGQALFEYLL